MSANYDYLQSVDFHPETLHHVLYSLWRKGGATLYYQSKGDLTLFVHPLLSEAIPVVFVNEVYTPAILENGKVKPMTGLSNEKTTREYQVLLEGLNRLYEIYRKASK